MQLHIVKDGQQRGPYSQMQVVELLREGALSPADLAWETGMAGWIPLGKMPAFETSPTAPAREETPAEAPRVAAIFPPVLQEHAADTPLADRATRFIAWLLDSLLGAALMLPGYLLMLRLDPRAEITQEYLSKHMTEYSTPLMVMGSGSLVVMIIQFFLLATQGQTVGKKVMGVRIVTMAGQRNPGFIKAVLMRTLVPAVITCLPLIGPAFFVLDACFIFRENRRCLHDLIAETVVVKARAVAAQE